MTPEESQVLGQSVAAAKGYADLILKPPLEQIGGILSDSIGLWRLKNQVRVMLKAKKFLESKGIKTPNKLQPDIVVPLLEGASYTEDETLSDMFARLLSAHADGERQAEVHPSFAKVLGQLSALDAQTLAMLDVMELEQMKERKAKGYFQREHVRRRQVIERVNEAYSVEVGLSLENLKRLGLCEDEIPTRDGTFEHWSIPKYGSRFLIACNGEDYWRRKLRDIDDPSRFSWVRAAEQATQGGKD